MIINKSTKYIHTKRKQEENRLPDCQYLYINIVYVKIYKVTYTMLIYRHCTFIYSHSWDYLQSILINRWAIVCISKD